MSGGSPSVPMAPIGSGFGVSSGSNKKPSRPPQPVKRQGGKANKGGAASQNNAAKAVDEPPGLLSGYHDMSNVETWVRNRSGHDYSVDFSQSRIGVKSAFSTNAQLRFASVVS